MIPDYQTLMTPVLKASANGEVKIGDVVDLLADEFSLTADDRSELLPSGRQTTFANRIHWAKTYLKQAGLVEPTKRGHFTITDRGKSVLADNSVQIDNRFLMQFPEFLDFRSRGKDDGVYNVEPEDVVAGKATPEELLREAYARINSTIAD